MRRTIILPACVLALNAADLGVIGAVVDQLRTALHIGNTEVGVLTAVPTAVAAIATLPVGQLTDRTRRVPLLAGSIVLWSLAMIAGGMANSFLWLLLSRVALGAVTATAGPTVASLIGDLFPPSQRARIYSRVLAGELAGAGFGLLVGGDAAAMISWRASFWLVAGCGFALALALWRLLPEPARTEAGTGTDSGTGTGDPTRLSLVKAARYVLGIRANRTIIVASAVGYFFFAGLRVFAIVFAEGQYGVSKIKLTAFLPVIGLGALAGVTAGGRLADGLTRRGHPAARVTVPGVAYAAAALIFLPGLLTHRTLLAVPLFTMAAAALAAANPPLDAARLDIVHSRLWGRAESIRTLARMSAEATAPIVFGRLSELLAAQGGATSHEGLARAFLIMLVPLLANGLLLLRARHTYPRDVAAATAAERRPSRPGG